MYIGSASGCLTTGIVTCKTYWINSSRARYVSNDTGGGALPLKRYVVVAHLFVVNDWTSLQFCIVFLPLKLFRYWGSQAMLM